MGEAIGQSLPLAVGVALSPVPIIAVVLMLTTARARANGPAFVLGWLVGLGVVGAIVLALAGPGGASEEGQPAAWVSWLKLVLGLGLVLVAVRQFRGRPRGDEEAPPAMREWAVKLEAKPKYVVSSTRKDFPWTNSHHIAGDLRTGVQKLKDATPAGVLLGSGKLATELDRLDLIDEYKFLVHPRIAGHGPTLYQSGLPSTRRLELVSAKPLRSGAVAMHYRRAR